MIPIKKNKLFFIIVLSSALCAIRIIQSGGIASCINPQKQEPQKPLYKSPDTHTESEAEETLKERSTRLKSALDIIKNSNNPKEIKKACKKLGI